MKYSLAAAMLLLVSPALADEIVIPNQAPTTAGSGGYTTLLRSLPRSYQLVIGPEELAAMPPGSLITGITWRRPTWQSFQDWPGVGATCSWTNYDIYLSTSENLAGALSTTYTDNLGADVTLVRGGPLSLTGAAFPGGALSPQTNSFGSLISFTTPYVYQGTELLLTIRHDGNNCGGSGSLDTVPSAFAQAIGVSSYTQSDSWYAQGLIVMKLEFTPGTGPGNNYCVAAPNSSRATGTISAAGLASVSANNLTLRADDLPPSQFGIFVVSRDQSFVVGAGGTSNGNLCLGGSIGRYNGAGQILSTGAAGTFALAIDLMDIPQGSGAVAVLPGETWNFQAWHREGVGLGSNFTDGLSIQFQ